MTRPALAGPQTARKVLIWSETEAEHALSRSVR